MALLYMLGAGLVILVQQPPNGHVQIAVGERRFGGTTGATTRLLGSHIPWQRSHPSRH